jgi:creatinine amidohydrolase
LPDAFVYTTFLHTSFGRGWQQVQSQRRSRLMGHACELETSYMLALRPDCVHMEWAVDEVDFLSSPNYAMDWVESGALIANPPWTDDTHTGSYGAPTLATASQGWEWLRVAVQDLSELVGEAQGQHLQRKRRRQGDYRLDSWRALWDDLK